ncbi:ethanolamine permease [Pseudonocardia sediminis]|uniref:Ethanolamine permease n=1 Tax=Pseudonocardia sediminis TaxID=1397368 RepID=A0A4Q7URZ4_PSEST|nr:ethanolamine permease [Pseudonocardia sediminis]
MTTPSDPSSAPARAASASPPSAGAAGPSDSATSDYLSQRQLRTGAAGWVLLAGLGVSYVISGDYSGWNFGLAEGGFGGLLIAGAGEALKVMFVVTGIALVGLVVFALGAIPLFDPANLVDIPVSDAAGASPFLPFGMIGIWSAVPFAIWFFLAVEGVPLAAEEAREPERNVPKAIVVSMLILLVTGAGVLVLATGALGAQALSASGNPLVEALGDGTLAVVVNYIGLAGLVASFFSIIYAYSRQTFALSRAGYLPRVLSKTNSRKAPTLALIVPGVIGFLLSLTGQGAVLLNMAVFGAALSYVLMMVSHIVLRRREPDMPRPYRTPGGVATTGFALAVAVIAVIATFLVDTVAALCALGAFALFMAYFAFYSRHHLVAAAPDEEFAALSDAEEELR